MNILNDKKLRYGNQMIKLFCVAMFTLFISNANAANSGGQVLTFNLKGTGTAYDGTVPALVKSDGYTTTDATCFDVELYDLSTGLQIGTATDCLSDINEEGDGLKLVGTTYFNFVGGATIISRGKTTVMPVAEDHGSPGFTHITGAGADGDGILSGTKQYSNASGSVRLSGLVDLSELGPNGGEITFDCIFVINLD